LDLASVFFSAGGTKAVELATACHLIQQAAQPLSDFERHMAGGSGHGPVFSAPAAGGLVLQVKSAFGTDKSGQSVDIRSLEQIGSGSHTVERRE
jgi:hypothetical protein